MRRYPRKKGANQDGPEDIFYKSLRETAFLLHCRLIRIPDPIIRQSDLNEKNQVINPGKFEKRWCDCILMTPGYNFFIELKAQENVLTPNEKKNLQVTESINESYYVVRRNQKYYKRTMKFETIYTIEKPGIWKVKIKFHHIEDIIQWFINLTERNEK